MEIINKKNMTNIPPLLENGIFVTNFWTKADIFKDLFVQQCSVHVNDSVLPNFISRCNLSLANIDVDPDKVLKIICSLGCNKAHGWDSLSIAVDKICDVNREASLSNIQSVFRVRNISRNLEKKAMSYHFPKKRVDN